MLQKLFAQLESGSGGQRTLLCWSLGTSPWGPQGRDRRTPGARWSMLPGILATVPVCLLPLEGVVPEGRIRA